MGCGRAHGAMCAKKNRRSIEGCGLGRWLANRLRIARPSCQRPATACCEWAGSSHAPAARRRLFPEAARAPAMPSLPSWPSSDGDEDEGGGGAGGAGGGAGAARPVTTVIQPVATAATATATVTMT